MNIPIEYVECWKDPSFVIPVVMFVAMGMLTIYFECKYLSERKRNKELIIKREDNTHYCQNADKQKNVYWRKW